MRRRVRNAFRARLAVVDMTTDIDWKMLRHKATEAAGKAYAPYSGLSVGAAALVDDHRMVAGCNVENVSYGLGLCAECAVVCALYSGGGGRLIALSCMDADGAAADAVRAVPPGAAGARRPEMLIDHPLGPRPLGELLPDAFGPDDLSGTESRDAEHLRRADRYPDQARRRCALRRGDRLGDRRRTPTGGWPTSRCRPC